MLGAAVEVWRGRFQVFSGCFNMFHKSISGVVQKNEISNVFIHRASMLLVLKSFLMWGKKQKKMGAVVESLRCAHGQLPFWLEQMGFKLLPAVIRINSNWSFIVSKIQQN